MKTASELLERSKIIYRIQGENYSRLQQELLEPLIKKSAQSIIEKGLGQ